MSFLKRTFYLQLLCLALLLPACGGRTAPEPTVTPPEAAPSETAAPEGAPLRIVATIFPEYDWVRQILGDRASDAELTLLLDSGTDLHSYQPTADDMVKLSACDLFLYVGGESDAWVEDALAEAVNPNMQILCLMDALGGAVKEEELVEGMEAEEEEEGEEEEIEYDEHVWLSLRNAQVLCAAIADRLCQLDPAHRETYAANTAAYIDQLRALDREYQSAAEGAQVKTVLFGDRFPFRYLVDDYGLSYYAAFVGCSAETEASFETVIFLANKVDELSLPAVLTIESGDGRIARTIVDNTAAKTAQILQMDSMQSTTAQDVAAGETYLSAMARNLDVLRQALGE
ncbi:MAG: zinc ABC transporter substrate-binding protein [Oscillibacter sp.]|nr:zinc ABC transporter substrate-binding protein [Oscillibacter sp.]